MKYKEAMRHIFTDTIPNWMKYHDEKDIRIVRKVYSIGDLRYASDYDLLSSGMSKPALEKIKHRLPSSSNLTINNNTILTSTLGKLLVRKLTHRSTTNMTKSTNDLDSNSQRQGPSIGEKNLELMERIGEGKFSTVFKARYRIKENEILTVAVKKFNQHDISIEQSFSRDLKHPHIIEFFGIVTHTDLFVMEYAPLKSLYHCLISTNSKREYSIEILLDYLKQIVSAMNYLEKKSIIHRNLSCRNFLVFSKSLIKLSDWNSATLPLAWLSPEVMRSQLSSLASDVFSFAVSMWECFSYGETPWNGMTNDQIINTIDSANHQRLSRPPYATSELYQIMLHCWKYQPSERPTFSQLEKALNDIEFERLQWKEHSIPKSNDSLPIESCRLGPLIILDRCLHISQSSNLIQCVSIDGQIGFVDHENVEPLHVISLPQSSAMNSFFHRKTGIKKNSTKTKTKQISKDMISAPQSDLIHAFHLGVPADMTNFNESIEQKLVGFNEDPSSSLLAEVMQAFTEISPETEINQEIKIFAEINSGVFAQSPSISPLCTIKTSDEISCRFTRELEERSRNGDLNKQGKHVYDSLINRRISNSSSASSSSNPEKSDYQSRYSSISSLNSRSSSINKNEPQPSITGQPLPPPPDLSSLGSKLTIATLTETFQLPKSLTLNKYRTKKRFNLFA